MSVLAFDRLRAHPAVGAVRAAVGLRIARDTTFTLAVLLLSGGLGWLLLHGLGTWDLFDWDESRHIVSGYEMLRSGDFVVNTYLGAPDYWNLKPPLSFWAIAGSIKLFGYTPFAVRLPSALATLVTVGLLSVFAFRRAGRVAAVITLAAAASCVLLLNYHSGRTADPDALFILFMTASVLSTLSAPRRPLLLIASVSFFSLAFLTKSWHAGLVLLFLGLYVVWTRRDSLVRLRHLTLALLGFLPVLIWAGLRFSRDGTQFFLGMIQYDLLTRGSSVIEGHTGPPLMYVQTILTTFSPWIVITFGAGCLVVAASSLRGTQLLRPTGGLQPVLGMGLWFALVLVSFSLAATKLVWYTTDAVAVLCSLTGVLVALALRKGGVRVAVVLLPAAVFALILGVSAVHDSKSAETANPLQMAFASVGRPVGLLGKHIYLDEALGGWSQSAVASAELGVGAAPRDGAADSFVKDGNQVRLIAVQDGSPMDQQVRRAESVRVVGSYYGVSVLATR